MDTEELREARRRKWHVDDAPVRTLDAARDFINSVGFCTLYPTQPLLLLPTFLGAYAGTDEGLPTWQHGFSDPRAKEATELMIRLLREKTAFESNVFGESIFLISATVFPFVYTLLGDRNPRTMPKPGQRSEYSPLARDSFEAIRTKGPISKQRLLEVLGGALSDAALDRALTDLWSHLRTTRVDYLPDEGSFWDVLHRWAPEAVRDGTQVSLPEALSALISKYLDCVIAAEQSEVEEFFSHLVSRSRVKEAVNALLAQREFALVHVGGKPMLQLAGQQPAPVVRKRSQPIVPRNRRPMRPRT